MLKLCHNTSKLFKYTFIDFIESYFVLLNYILFKFFVNRRTGCSLYSTLDKNYILHINKFVSLHPCFSSTTRKRREPKMPRSIRGSVCRSWTFKKPFENTGFNLLTWGTCSLTSLMYCKSELIWAHFYSVFKWILKGQFLLNTKDNNISVMIFLLIQQRRWALYVV